MYTITLIAFILILMGRRQAFYPNLPGMRNVFLRESYSLVKCISNHQYGCRSFATGYLSGNKTDPA